MTARTEESRAVAAEYQCASCEHGAHDGPCPINVGRQASLFGGAVLVACPCPERVESTRARPALPGLFDSTEEQSA